MNVSLTPALEKIVQEKVSSGMYNSASEVIREALRMMVENDKLQLAKLKALREEIDIGIREADQGLFEEYDADTAHQILDRIKSRRK
ncbi:MAG: type II toxin-antitoxin system ParD family antitoxin [Myxococcota bacterium]|nr:type II toxin-antitoxin system ParD family antitoxin [Myxococcota bacterium]